jgi:chemotaxis signal transduction protein
MTLDFLEQLDGRISADSIERKVILFKVHDILCALDIMSVMEIVNPLAIISIPDSHPSIKGMTDYRQAAISVIDLRILFGASATPDRRNKWIIVQMADGTTAALLVDNVVGVSIVLDKDQREQHSLGDSTGSKWSKAIYGSPDGLIFELDLEIISAVFHNNNNE